MIDFATAVVRGNEPVFDSEIPAEVVVVAQTFVNTASPKTHVYLRMKGDRPIGVNLVFGHALPTTADFVPAESLGLTRRYPVPIFPRNGKGE